MPEQIQALLGDLEDMLEAYRRRDWGEASAANLVRFLDWFIEELTKIIAR